MFVAGMFMLSACSKDDDTPENKLSDLTAEEHKQNMEDEGVKFVQNMDAIASLEVYDVMEQFTQLMDQSNFGAYAPLQASLDKIADLRNQPPTSVDLKSYSEGEINSFSAGFNELAGIYTWDGTEWTEQAATDQITFNFNVEEKTASISLYNFTYKTATNQDATDFTVELPTSLNMSIKLGEAELCSFTFTGEYYDNDTPKYLEEVFNLEGFVLKGIFDLKDKSHLKTSGEFKYNETIILANGFELEGNVDYTAIKAKMDQLEGEDGLPMDQDIVEKTNAYFQIGNVKADALFDVKSLLNDMQNVSAEEQTDEKMVELLNKNVKVYVRYADSKEVMAYGQFYMAPYSDYGETYYELSMRMILSDESAIDGSFFDNGFGDMISEINALIAKLNTNYGADLDLIQ